MATVEVTETTLYSRDMNKKNGLLDSAFGTLDRRTLCTTCGKTCQSCPGHTGVMRFPLPLYHMSYIDSIIKILRSVCFLCSRPCMTPNTTSNTQDCKSTYVEPQHARKSFNKQYAYCKMRRRCAYCDAPCPDYVRNGNDIDIVWGEKSTFASPEEEAFCRKPFTRLCVDSILNCISDEDAESLGFTVSLCHPRNFMLWVLLIPSPSIRLSLIHI